MKIAMIAFIALLTMSNAGACQTVTITDGQGRVHTILVCD